MSRPLQGRSTWMTRWSTFTVLAGILVAVLYCALAVSFPPGSLRSFAVVLGVVVVLFNFVGDGIEQGRLGTLRALGDGKLAPEPPRLLEAALEVLRAPDVTFWVVLGFLGVGVIGTCGLWASIADPPLEVVLRVAFVGITIAPLTAMMSHLATLPRARQVLRELVALGLPVTALYEAAPRRFELRRRLVFFSLVAVATPLLLVGDLLLRRARAVLIEVAGAATPTALDGLAGASALEGLSGVAAIGGVVLVLVAATAWLSGTALGTPLRELAAETERLARGQYGAPRFVPAEYETWTAAGAVAAMEAHLLALIGQLGEASRDIAGATGALQGGGKLGEATAEGALGATTQTTGELARSAREIAANAQRVSELARETLDAARGGRTGADSFLEAMGQVRQGNQAIADSVVRLNKRVQQVGRIIEFINGIADKSDLLALNAELEGNKAGEVGRGFSLVAAEMRRLAESVMQSTQEIARLIDEIRDATNAAVMATEAGVKATDAGALLAQKVGQRLSQIVEYANQSSDAMQSISLATAQQQAGTDQLVAAMGEIVKSTEASSAAALDMATAHDQLIALAADLATTVQRFEVET